MFFRLNSKIHLWGLTSSNISNVCYVQKLAIYRLSFRHKLKLSWNLPRIIIPLLSKIINKCCGLNFNFCLFPEKLEKYDIILRRCRYNKYKNQSHNFVNSGFLPQVFVCVHIKCGFHTSFDICSAQNTSSTPIH